MCVYVCQSCWHRGSNFGRTFKSHSVMWLVTYTRNTHTQHWPFNCPVPHPYATQQPGICWNEKHTETRDTYWGNPCFLCCIENIFAYVFTYSLKHSFTCQLNTSLTIFEQYTWDNPWMHLTCWSLYPSLFRHQLWADCMQNQPLKVYTHVQGGKFIGSINARKVKRSTFMNTCRVTFKTVQTQAAIMHIQMIKSH